MINVSFHDLTSPPETSASYSAVHLGDATAFHDMLDRVQNNAASEEQPRERASDKAADHTPATRDKTDAETRTAQKDHETPSRAPAKKTAEVHAAKPSAAEPPDTTTTDAATAPDDAVTTPEKTAAPETATDTPATDVAQSQASASPTEAPQTLADTDVAIPPVVPVSATATTPPNTSAAAATVAGTPGTATGAGQAAAAAQPQGIGPVAASSTNGSANGVAPAAANNIPSLDTADGAAQSAGVAAPHASESGGTAKPAASQPNAQQALPVAPSSATAKRDTAPTKQGDMASTTAVLSAAPTDSTQPSAPATPAAPTEQAAKAAATAQAAGLGTQTDAPLAVAVTVEDAPGNGKGQANQVTLANGMTGTDHTARSQGADPKQAQTATAPNAAAANSSDTATTTSGPSNTPASGGPAGGAFQGLVDAAHDASPPTKATSSAPGRTDGIGAAPTTTSTHTSTPSTATAGAAAPKPAPLPLPAAEQVAVHVAKAASEGVDKISVKLKPASLGHIEVQMDVASDGRVHVVISADRPETLDLLQRDARSLERALGDAGLRADSQSMSFNLRDHSQSGGNGNSGFADSRGWGRNAPAHDLPETTEHVRGYVNGRAATGGVDIRV